MERGEILDLSYDLYHKHCNGCTKWRIAGTKKHLKCVQDYCEKQCPIGRKLLELGDRLTYGRPTVKARALIKDVYLEEKAAGLLDRDIRKKYGIGEQLLIFRKKFWGVYQEDQCTKERYLREKEKGLPDEYIAQKLGVGGTTLTERKLIWGINAEKVINENITPENYITHKKNGLRDKEIAKVWGIGMSTLRKRKRVWRGQGTPVDQYNLVSANKVEPAKR